MAGTPPATCAVAPTRRAASLIRSIVPERLMRAQHVVIGGDDAEVRAARRHQRVLVTLHGGIGMGLVAPRQMRAARAFRGEAAHAIQIGGAGVARPVDDAVGHGCDPVVEWHGVGPSGWLGGSIHR